MNKMLAPTIQMDGPNEPILIYNDVATVKYDRYGIITQVCIYNLWFPYDRVDFKFSLSSIPALWLDLALDVLNKRIEILINNDSTWVGIVYGVKERDNEVTFTGSIEPPIVTTSNKDKVKRIDFSIFNFRTYVGYFGLTMPGVSVKPCHFERSSKVG